MRLRIQLIRYAVVGLASNIALYLLYLVLTYLRVGAKTAMTGLYILGVLQTFVFNRRWSFRHSGHAPTALRRYAMAYGVGYVLNLGAQLLFVDRWALPHQTTQGASILTLAALLFLAQKYWVFRETTDAARGDPAPLTLERHEPISD